MQINRKFLALCRTVHVYLTMFGIFVMLLFGITGFTINHEAWFGATTPRVTELAGKAPPDLIAKAEAGDALFLVEHLRQTYKINGALTSLQKTDDGLRLAFKSPSEECDAEIDRADGATRVHLESSNFVALVNNLHRGKFAGAAWGLIIDLAALLIVMACLTGVVLWLVLPKRRKLGLIALATGLAVVGVVYWLLVPGADALRVR